MYTNELGWQKEIEESLHHSFDIVLDNTESISSLLVFLKVKFMGYESEIGRLESELKKAEQSWSERLQTVLANKDSECAAKLAELETKLNAEHASVVESNLRDYEAYSEVIKKDFEAQNETTKEDRDRLAIKLELVLQKEATSRQERDGLRNELDALKVESEEKLVNIGEKTNFLFKKIDFLFIFFRNHYS